MNKLLLISLLLLAIFAVGAVSASEDVSATGDVVSVDDGSDIQADEDDEVDIYIDVDEPQDLYEFEVDNDDTITVELEEDVTGVLTVEIDGSPAKLSCDEYYIYVNYDATSYNQLSLPSDGPGDDDETAFEISLDMLTPGTYNVAVYFTTSDNTYSESFNIKLIGETPVEDEAFFDVDDSPFPIGEENAITLTIMPDVEGTLTVKINGTQAKLSRDDDCVVVSMDTGETSLILPESINEEDYYIILDNLGPGTYNVTVSFITDVRTYSESFEITLVNGVIIEAENGTFTIGDDDAIGIIIPPNVSGALTVIINGTQVGLTMDDDEATVLVLKNGVQTSISLPLQDDVGDLAEYFISLDKLDPNKTYKVTVTFTTQNNVYSESFTITLVKGEEPPEYEAEMYVEDSYLFNRTGNRINITASREVIDTLTITINDVEYTINKTADDAGYIDISNLPIGEYTVILTFDGMPVEDYFEVVAIYWPATMVYASSNYIAASLPVNASGNLTVIIDGNVVGSVAVENGFAQIPIPVLSVGTYDVTIQYPGEEKDVDEMEAEINVIPKITYPSQMTVGEDKYLIIEVGDNQGILTVKADYDDYYVIRFNGIAKVPLKNLPCGEVTIEISYSDDNNNRFEDEFEIDVKELPIKFVAKNVKMVYTGKGVFKVQVYDVDGKPAADNSIDYIKIGSKTYRYVDTDKNGVAKLKISKTFAPGKYKITVKFEDAAAKYSLNIKHLLKLKAVKVKKSAKKLVIKATLGKVNGKYLKGKKITFKFNGKKFTAKTNKKGVAKVTIKQDVLKKLKVGKKVKYQATYLKDTVKKSVKVKK